MPWCVAVGCNNNTFKVNRNKDVTFFSMPKDEDLKKKWFTNIKRENLPKHPKICHLHFEQFSFKRDLQHELLQKPLRRMLNDDAIPTLFAHNANKQSQKRKTSVLREEARAKRQLCEDAINLNERFKEFEFECNTKETQTETTYVTTATPTESQVMVDVYTQCNIIDINLNEEEISDVETLTEGEDSDYIESNELLSESESEYFQTSFLDGYATDTPKPPKAAFIVYWCSLVMLLKKCLHLSCSLPASITRIAVKGSQLIVKMKCSKEHYFTWRSQPNVSRYSQGNLSNAAAVLFSANSYQRLADFFDLASIQWISKTSFYAIQKKYLAGVVNKNYNLMSQNILEEIKLNNSSCQLSGDGRCDSPGHNAKYLTYTFMDKNTDKIVAFSLVQVSEAGNSNRMEKLGFQRSLTLLKNEGIVPEQIATDRHTQIRKYMREEEAGINHQFDVWHFAKNIKKQLLAASKKSSCRIIEKWIKSIGNHFWWVCGTCEGDVDLLREKWTSVLFHIQNKHKWTGGNKFSKCAHPPLTKAQKKRKQWILPNSEALEALQKIVLSKSVLKDLKYLTEFSHTGVLEVYHSLYNKWAPNRQHFSYTGMHIRSQLAVMDFNQGSDLKQATTQTREKRYNVHYSKITKNWSSKPNGERNYRLRSRGQATKKPKGSNASEKYR